MSFPVAELITTAVIEDRLEYLSKHPDHLNWMLSPYVMYGRIARLVDAKYVAQCVEYLHNNRPMVKPVYELDMQKMPSIVVSSYQAESQQFLGDEGSSVMASEQQPRSILTFDALSVLGNTVVVSSNQKVLETVWPSLYFQSGDFSSNRSRGRGLVGPRRPGSCWNDS
jgi:hypothetical protein